MKITRLLSQSFNSLWHNKARSGLTILGIVIGIAAVISLVALGNGLEASTLDRFSGLGADRMTISSQDPTSTTDEETATDSRSIMRSQLGGGSTSEPSLSEVDYQIIRDFDNIALTSPQILSSRLEATTDIDTVTVTLTGVDASFETMQELDVSSGLFIDASQVESAENVVIVSDNINIDLFGGNAIGQTLDINGIVYTVIGVLAPVDAAAGGIFGGGRTETLYAPYTTVLEVNEEELMSTIVASVEDEGKVSGTAEELVETLYESHGIDENTADISITIAQDTIDAINSVQGSFTSTLTGIAAISLLVGGIGIMNIMLVTVSERTREIGLRRAVGAKKHHIAIQFLTEATLLTFIGGLIGLLTGLAFSTRAGDIITLGRTPGSGGTTSDIAAVVDMQTIVLALSMSIIIGIVFGLFPAIKAARKDPVEALRYE